jgi:two-component system, cell cycle sensor histidine kinase and response regulator CckA
MNERHAIVLVEDEESVLTVMQRVLERAGYEVFAFANPVKASQHLAVAPEPSILITDVVMPGMNGFDLCGVVRARFPELPVIFTSGYPLENLPGGAATLPENSRLISKPFGLDLVRATISELLELAQGSRRVTRV